MNKSPCKKSQTLDRSTKRCRKKKSPGRKSPKRKSRSLKRKSRYPKRKSRSPKRKSSSLKRKSCKPGKVFNRSTKRCRDKKSPRYLTLHEKWQMDS